MTISWIVTFVSLDGPPGRKGKQFYNNFFFYKLKLSIS